MNILFKASIMAGAAMMLASSANAAITVYTTQAAFLAAIGTPSVDTFNDLSQSLIGSPLNRPLGYQVSAGNGLFPGFAGSVFMSTNTATDPMTFSNFTSSPSAIGGFFFSSNISGSFTPSTRIRISVTDTSGNIVEVINTPTTGSFRGFTTNSAILSLTVTGFNPVPAENPLWPSVDNLHLAEVLPAVFEPASWAMMIAGFGLVGALMRRRRELQAAA